MLKTFGMVAAAALLASVTAFAQNEPSSSPSSSDQAPATAPADNSASSDNSATDTEKPMKHHRHHSRMGTGSRATDDNADKLNACMSNATPTAQQEQCLKAAAGTGNG